jgi:hypothetical protein
MALVSNQTSLIDYLRDRPYLIKIFISLGIFAFMTSFFTYTSNANLDRFHVEHSLMGGLLIFAALNIGFSESFGKDLSSADRWYSISSSMITGCTIGGFLTLVILRGIIKLDPTSGAYLLLIYSFSLIFGAGLTLASRFHQHITPRCLLLFSSIIAAQLIGCHLEGSFSLLTALLVGLFHQVFIALYDNYQSYVEVIERGLMSGSLITSTIVVLFWLPTNQIWIMHGPFVVRVLALGFGERPDLKACLTLLICSACSVGFLLYMRSVNKPEFAKRYNTPTSNQKTSPLALQPAITGVVPKLSSGTAGGSKIILRP